MGKDKEYNFEKTEGKNCVVMGEDNGKKRHLRHRCETSFKTGVKLLAPCLQPDGKTLKTDVLWEIFLDTLSSLILTADLSIY